MAKCRQAIAAFFEEKQNGSAANKTVVDQILDSAITDSSDRENPSMLGGGRRLGAGGHITSSEEVPAARSESDIHVAFFSNAVVFYVQSSKTPKRKRGIHTFESQSKEIDRRRPEQQWARDKVALARVDASDDGYETVLQQLKNGRVPTHPSLHALSQRIVGITRESNTRVNLILHDHRRADAPARSESGRGAWAEAGCGHAACDKKRLLNSVFER